MQVTSIVIYEGGKMEGGITTSLTPAKTESTSLRTTVPMSIVRQFNLNSRDKLSWKLKVEEGELVIIVKPIKS